MQIFWDFTKRYFLRYKAWYLSGVFLIMVTQGLAVTIIDQTRQAIDAAGAQGATSGTVLPFVLRIVLFAVLLVIARIGSRMLVFTPGRLMEYHVRNQYLNKLLFLQRDFYQEHETGDLVSRCTNDIMFVRAAYGFGGLQIANVAITLSFGIGAMLQMDPRITLYLAIPMLIAFVIIQVSIMYLYPYWRKTNEQIGAMSSVALASFKGVSAIQNYHAEPKIEGLFNKANDEYLDTQIILAKNRSFIMPIAQMVGNLSIFVVLWFVGPRVITQELSLGQVTAFLGYIAMVMPPLLMMGWMLNVFTRAIPGIERLNAVLLSIPNLPQVNSSLDRSADGAVHLAAKNLHFRFPNPVHQGEEPFALKDIDFDLPKGKILGVVGSVGSGKTALIESLVRLNQIEGGQLFLNGEDACDLDLNNFRDYLSFVAQRPFLFSTSLRQNLRIALPAESWDRPDLDEVLIKHLELACFDLDPKQFPEGLDTMVGEKGIMLSGGQRQRIALARALLKPAEIYILDDVLSAVDHDTERKIIENIRNFAPGKSVVIASHRLSAVQWADEILVLENGQVVDRGHHDQLVSRPGFYQDVFRHQSQKLE